MKPTDILTEILGELKKSNARDDDLWTKKDIADYLKMSESSVVKILNHNDFPRAVQMPTSGNGSHPRWVAGEVKRFTLQHRAV